MLNRFKNSTFFSEQTDSVTAEPEKYYSRSIARDPNGKQLTTSVRTFGTRKNLKSRSIAKESPTPSGTLHQQESERESKGCYVLRTQDPTGYFKNRNAITSQLWALRSDFDLYIGKVQKCKFNNWDTALSNVLIVDKYIE